MQLSDYQRDILIRTVLGEARGEGDLGMAAVAHNIRNRAQSGRFPDDPAKVALQPKQYSVWNEGEGGGRTSYSQGSDLYKRAGQLVDRVFSGEIPDMTGGALYYHTPEVSPDWSRSVNKHGTSQIGNHIFYHGRPTPPEDIPQVASLLDVVPPKEAPVPVTPSGLTQTYRQPGWSDALSFIKEAQMGTLDEAPYRALIAEHQPEPVIDRAAITDRDLILDRGISDTVQGTAAMQKGDLASALDAYIRRDQTPTRSTSDIARVYANGGPTRPPAGNAEAPQQPRRNATAAEVAAAGQGAAFTAADGPTAALVDLAHARMPHAKRSAAPMPTNVAQSYAGQESTRVAQAAAPTAPKRSAADLAAVTEAAGWSDADGPAARVPTAAPLMRQAAAPAPAKQSDGMAVFRAPVGETVAEIPTTGGVGKPPATKVAASVPVKGSPKPAQMSDDLAVSRAPGAEVTSTVPTGSNPIAQRLLDTYKQGGPTQPGPKMTAVSTAPTWGAFADTFPSTKAPTLVAEPAKPNPSGHRSGYVKEDNTRLAPSAVPAAPQVATSLPPLAPAGRVQVVDAPQVATALDVKPPAPPAIGLQPIVAGPEPIRKTASPKPAPATRVSLPAQQPTARTASFSAKKPQVTIGDMIGNALRNAPLVKLLQGQNPFDGSAGKLMRLRPFSSIDQNLVTSMIGQGLLNQASANALQSGQHSYVSSDGAVMPTTSMSGKIRNTYGD